MPKEVIYKLPTTRPKVKKRVQPIYDMKTLRYEVEVTVKENGIAGSEYERILDFVRNTKAFRQTLLNGIDQMDNEFREIDPLRNIKVKVHKKD